ncbi:class I SAM-dependent methyltransferase [Micromonospora sp. 15K316]|uniref:class I SAM-dependent methyltransferase n=1 Tax=Micromonospora sp. 15K316 TaxID=2530376 RepID=UPI00104A94A2|nr:class I SAM-dependent methyltransferase [Micromonospora sp. 15K316]TDC40273.1 class I SAM-dependent methyltransferase [Micromonospora sp. 15K316]
MTTETAPADRIVLPGGEMLTWSDLPEDRPVTAGALAVLAARVVPAGASVLVAGPHDPALLDRLAHAEVTCLLRGYPDGAALAPRAARVVVGGPAGLGDEERFDVVIAGAGLDPIESVEGARLGWGGVLDRLTRVLRPGGTLLLWAENPMGLRRLVDTDPWYARRDDAAWSVTGVLDIDHPANRDQLRDRLAGAGLRPDACFAAYPDAGARALIDADELAGGATCGLFDAVLHDVGGNGFAAATVLQDPARLAVDALHAGLGAALAPGWVVLATKEPASGPSAALPVALLQTGPGGDVLEVVAGPQGWRWQVTSTARSETPAAPFATREVACRDLTTLDGQPVPQGRLLRTLLLDAALRRDLDGLRRLLRGYAEWLAGQAGADGELGGAVALATVDNVLRTDGGYTLLDPSWQVTAPLNTEVVLARGLRRFATTLVTGGYAHPWPSTLDIAGLTVVLGGVAGHDLSRETVSAAVETEAAVTAAVRGLDNEGRGVLLTELRAVEPTDPPAGPRSYQQLHEAWRRQREELTRLTALLRWTEELLTSRERALRRAEVKINLLSGSVSYQVGRFAVTPARLARRGARAAKRRVRDVLAPKPQEGQ